MYSITKPQDFYTKDPNKESKSYVVGSKTNPLKNYGVEDLVKFIKVMHDPNYRNILDYIYTSEKSINVTEIYIKTRMDRATISKNLAALRYFKLVYGTRDGKEVYYTNCNRIGSLEILQSYVDAMTEQFNSLMQTLE